MFSLYCTEKLHWRTADVSTVTMCVSPHVWFHQSWQCNTWLYKEKKKRFVCLIPSLNSPSYIYPLRVCWTGTVSMEETILWHVISNYWRYNTISSNPERVVWQLHYLCVLWLLLTTSNDAAAPHWSSAVCLFADCSIIQLLPHSFLWAAVTCKVLLSAHKTGFPLVPHKPGI